MSLLRSTIFSVPLIALCTIVMDLLSMVVSFFDRSGNRAHHLARAWGKMLLAVSFVRVHAGGMEQLDPNGHLCLRRQSRQLPRYPRAARSVPQQFRFFAKKGLYKIPFLGWHLARAGHFPVDRSNPRKSLKSMTEAARVIGKRHVPVLNFPEGGRSVKGLRAFKEGAAYIAIKAGVPVVP